MSGFTKLVPEIVLSSVWNKPSDIRIVWITLLAIKDENGYVRGDAETISRIANVTLEAAESALAQFQEPDLSSHTPDNDGRRIAPMPGGWLVLNHELYRIRDDREATRERVRRFRERKRTAACVTPSNVTVTLPSASASVSPSESFTGEADPGKETQLEASPAREGSQKRAKPSGRYDPAVVPPELVAVPGFDAAWAAYLENRAAKKDGRATTRAQEAILKRLAERPADAVRGLEEAQIQNWTGFQWAWCDKLWQEAMRLSGTGPGGGRKLTGEEEVAEARRHAEQVMAEIKAEKERQRGW